MSRRIEIAARTALQRKRRQLLRLYAAHSLGESELMETREPDFFDCAAQSCDAASLELLNEQELRWLEKVVQALARIEYGQFGTCEQCNGTIGLRRLEALPWTALCIACAQMTTGTEHQLSKMG